MKIRITRCADQFLLRFAEDGGDVKRVSVLDSSLVVRTVSNVDRQGGDYMTYSRKFLGYTTIHRTLIRDLIQQRFIYDFILTKRITGTEITVMMVHGNAQ